MAEDEDKYFLYKCFLVFWLFCKGTLFSCFSCLFGEINAMTLCMLETDAHHLMLPSLHSILKHMIDDGAGIRSDCTQDSGGVPRRVGSLLNKLT